MRLLRRLPPASSVSLRSGRGHLQHYNCSVQLLGGHVLRLAPNVASGGLSIARHHACIQAVRWKSQAASVTTRDSVVVHNGAPGWCRRPVVHHSFHRNKNLQWHEIDVFGRERWAELGWTSDAWDSGDPSAAPPSAQKEWQDLTLKEQAAAQQLGYDEDLWNEDEGELWRDHASKNWGDMHEVYRSAWSDLGWTEEEWNKRQPGEPFSRKHKAGLWIDLSTREQEAAARLGFYGYTWNEQHGKKSFFSEKTAVQALLLSISLAYAYHWMTGRAVKKEYNDQEDQVTAVHLRRMHSDVRNNWEKRCEDIGFLFHSAHGVKWGSDWSGSLALQDPYWCESGVYVLSPEAKEELDRASWELHNMCLEAVDRVVGDEELLELFQVPHRLRGAVRESWRAQQPDLLGRFDLLYDGSGPPRLLEYNADTPTLLLESSLAQSQWLQDRRSTWPLAEQFNYLDEELSNIWPTFLQRAASACGLNISRVHFAAQRASLEERCNIDYLAGTAKKAGITSELVEIEDLVFGGDGVLRHDPSNQVVEALWKLYPYEWLAEEDLGAAVELGAPCIWSEPPWKCILSNKSILALLWKMFPDHPNLLPAFFTIEEAEEYQMSQGVASGQWGWVAKPRYGREGIGIRYSFDSPSLRSFERQVIDDLRQLESFGHTGNYRPDLLKQMEQLGRKALGQFDNQGTHHLLPERREESLRSGADLRAEIPFPPLGGPVFQLYLDTATFSGRRPVVGSWVVYGKPAGICIREDIQRTTDNDSCFTPHIVDPVSTAILKVAGSAALEGCYALSGQLGGNNIYHCKEKGLYLLKNSERNWMFTPHEAGGNDHMQGLAVAEGGGSDALDHCSVPGSAWHVASSSGELVQGPTLSVTRSPQRELSQNNRKLSKQQEEIRRGLYGKEAILGVVERGTGSEHRSSAHSASHGGYYSRYPSQWQQQQQQQHHHQQQQQSQKTSNDDKKSKHGRKSAANNAWRQYGKGSTAKTGSYGMRSSSMSSGGSGGS